MTKMQRVPSLVLVVLLTVTLGLILSTTIYAKTTIRFMGWGSLQEKNNVEKAIARFEQENPDIEIQWIHVPENYLQKLQIMIAGGTPPDVFWVATDYYQEFASKGLLYDITKFLESDPEIGAPDYFIQPQEKDRMYINGKAYGIGSCWVSIHLYYNKDIFEAAGIELPPSDPDAAWTWEEFEEIAARLTVDSKGRTALDAGFDPNDVVQFGVNIPTWWLPLLSVIWSNGGTFYNDDYTAFTVDDPKTLEALDRIADLMKRGIAPRSAAFQQVGMTAQQMLATGKVAMHISGSWELQDLALMDFELGTGIVPRPRDGKPATAIQAHMHGIYAGTKYPKEAWRLLRFISSDEYQRDLVAAGLWLPSHTSLMTEEGINSWWNPAVHPPEYVGVGLDYMDKYGITVVMPPGATKGIQAFEQALDPVWLGRETAADAMKKALPQMNEALREAAE